MTAFSLDIALFAAKLGLVFVILTLAIPAILIFAVIPFGTPLTIAGRQMPPVVWFSLKILVFAFSSSGCTALCPGCATTVHASGVEGAEAAGFDQYPDHRLVARFDPLIHGPYCPIM